MFKESHWNFEIIIALFLFSAVYSTKKHDFGSLTACVHPNQSLTVNCSYPVCGNTPFDCDLYDVDGDKKTLIGTSNTAMINSLVSYLNASSGKCQLNIKDHALIYRNTTKVYTCNLSRRKSKEKKSITVKYTGNRKERPKTCSKAGLFPRGVSRLLWSILFLFLQETYF